MFYSRSVFENRFNFRWTDANRFVACSSHPKWVPPAAKHTWVFSERTSINKFIQKLNIKLETNKSLYSLVPSSLWLLAMSNKKFKLNTSSQNFCSIFVSTLLWWQLLIWMRIYLWVWPRDLQWSPCVGVRWCQACKGLLVKEGNTSLGWSWPWTLLLIKHTYSNRTFSSLTR